MLHSIAAVLYRRAAEDPPEYDLPAWSWAVVLANFVVFLPVILLVSYTLKFVFPVLAIVEDPNPPAYDPLPLADPDPADPDSAAAAAGGAPKPTPAVPAGAPVTTSLRATFRLLLSYGRWRAPLRGLFCLLVQSFCQATLVGLFSAFLPLPFSSLASLLSLLALCQLSAAWTHIVITPPSPLWFWKRLPPFRRAFDASARALALFWLATELTSWLPLLTALALGLRIPNFNEAIGAGSKHGGVIVPPPQDPGRQHGDAPFGSAQLGKAFVVWIVALTGQIFLVLPARVVLVRVQASLLPVDEDAVVPFDRSFEGRVEPAVVGGKGYATISDAWKTFRRASWRRLIVLYIKIFAISTAAYGLMALILIPQIALIIKHSTRKN